MDAKIPILIDLIVPVLIIILATIVVVWLANAFLNLRDRLVDKWAKEQGDKEIVVMSREEFKNAYLKEKEKKAIMKIYNKINEIMYKNKGIKRRIDYITRNTSMERMDLLHDVWLSYKDHYKVDYNVDKASLATYLHNVIKWELQLIIRDIYDIPITLPIIDDLLASPAGKKEMNRGTLKILIDILGDDIGAVLDYTNLAKAAIALNEDYNNLRTRVNERKKAYLKRILRNNTKEEVTYLREGNEILDRMLEREGL